MNFKLTTFLITLLVSVSAQAGLWEKMTTMGATTVKPSSEYLIETAGWNIRVYEWIPACSGPLILDTFQATFSNSAIF